MSVETFVGFLIVQLFYIGTDISTCVGYYVVSRPFLNINNNRHIHSTYEQILQVEQQYEHVR
jgi:hypothetical protein